MRAELLVNQLEQIKTDNKKIKKSKEDINVELDVYQNEKKCTEEKMKEIELRLKKIN